MASGRATMRAQSAQTWPFPLRDLVQQIHQSLICFQSLRREARQNASEVGAVELRVLLNLAGQESLAERAGGNEADSKLLQRRQHFLLRIAIPQGILALHRGNRLHCVSSTDRSRS